MVGYAALQLFIDPKTAQQPLSAYVHDYVLNTVRELVLACYLEGTMHNPGSPCIHAYTFIHTLDTSFFMKMASMSHATGAAHVAHAMSSAKGISLVIIY